MVRGARGDVSSARSPAPGDSGGKISLADAMAAGVAHHRAGDLHRAQAIYRQILDVQPENSDVLHLLGRIAFHRRDAVGAVDLVGRAIAAHPEIAPYHYLLGGALLVLGRTGEAARAYRRAIALDPEYADAYNDLGTVLSERGEIDEAMGSFRRALQLRPEFTAAHNNLGNALRDAGRPREAVAALRSAIAIEPDVAEIHNNLGNALRDLGQFDDAVRAFRYALDLRPDFAEGQANLGNVFLSQGRLDEAAAAYRASLRQEADATVHSNLVYCLCHDPRATVADIAAEARRWDAAHGAPPAGRTRPHANDPDPERRLRIGYVSPDFRSHAVTYFFEPLFTAHDRDRVEIFCYAEVARPDETTERYRAGSDGWLSTIGLSDSTLAGRIRDDRIDILVDLAGHTAGNRLPVFAGRPAPVQVSYPLGLGHTSGMTAIDYLLGDPWFTPEGFEDRFSETLWRLPRCFLGFRPSADWPEVEPLPARRVGNAIFVSFANPYRIGAVLAETWVRILQAAPDARLLLMHRLFGDGSVAERLRPAFAAPGVAERVEFRAAKRGWPGDMDVYATVDIALDTFPLTGGTTNCIALWMGVPVITLASEETHDRIGHDLLSAAGFDDGVASSRDDYVARAVDLVRDPVRLAGLRAGLRPRMRASPLLDHEALARAIEDAYRGMWRKWCETVGR